MAVEIRIFSESRDSYARTRGYIYTRVYVHIIIYKVSDFNSFADYYTHRGARESTIFRWLLEPDLLIFLPFFRIKIKIHRLVCSDTAATAFAIVLQAVKRFGGSPGGLCVFDSPRRIARGGGGRGRVLTDTPSRVVVKSAIFVVFFFFRILVSRH